MHPKLIDFQEDAPFEVPKLLQKGQSIIRIDGFIWSNKARNYYNVTFLGTLVERNGMPEEYVIGHLEVDKENLRVDQCNVRYSRFTQLRDIAKFANMLNEYITNKRNK